MSNAPIYCLLLDCPVPYPLSTVKIVLLRALKDCILVISAAFIDETIVVIQVPII